MAEQMRPLHLLLALVFVLFVTDTVLFFHASSQRHQFYAHKKILDITTAGLGLTDLCVSTEARYTRHPAVSDTVVPFMDHPGGLEHFPTGSFWAPPFQSISMNNPEDDRNKGENR